MKRPLFFFCCLSFFLRHKMEKLRNSTQWSLGPQHHDNQLWSNEGEGVHMLITCVILMMIDVVMQGQGRVTWRIMRFLLVKLFCQPFCIGSEVVVLAMEVQWFWFRITWSFMVQTLKKLIDSSYRSRIVRGQSTLKDVERYVWNGLSREHLKAMKALYDLYALYSKYTNVLVEKPRTCWKKAKSEIWNQTAYTLGNLLNNTIIVRLKNKTLVDANCLWRKTPSVATIKVRMVLISGSERWILCLFSLQL